MSNFVINQYDDELELLEFEDFRKATRYVRLVQNEGSEDWTTKLVTNVLNGDQAFEDMMETTGNRISLQNSTAVLEYDIADDGYGHWRMLDDGNFVAEFLADGTDHAIQIAKALLAAYDQYFS